MFSDWTDPNDIDHYYDGVPDLFKDISSFPSGSNLIKPSTTASPEPKIEQLTPNEYQPVAIPPEPFAVKPGSTFLDGHPVGRQSEYNILRSGPPKKEEKNPESFSSKKENYCGSCTKLNINQILVIMVFMIILLYIVYLKFQLMGQRMAFKVFMATHINSESS